MTILDCDTNVSTGNSIKGNPCSNSDKPKQQEERRAQDQTQHQQKGKVVVGGGGLPKSYHDLVRLLQLIPHPEGGYFRETWRSGVTPMQSRGLTDAVNVTRPDHDLVMTNRRSHPRDDGRRHVLTSIYWVPTLQSPKLPLAVNESDHVHYYQGGRPFEYFLYQPQLPLPQATTDNDDHSPTAITTSASSQWTHVILGPNLCEGHQLQVAVAGGTWKCGRIVVPDTENSDDNYTDSDEADYTVIGEAVGPGFDFHDFGWITLEQIEQQADYLDAPRCQQLKEYCHPMNFSQTLDEIDAHYGPPN